MRMKTTKNILESYKDVDYEPGKDGHSQEGAIFTAFGPPIGRYRNRQNTISLSIYEVECLTTSHALQEVQWLRRVIFDIQPAISQLKPTEMHIDNE